MVESLKSVVREARSEDGGIASQLLNHLSHPALVIHTSFGQHICILGGVTLFCQMSFVGTQQQQQQQPRTCIPSSSPCPFKCFLEQKCFYHALSFRTG
ncbi:hypothetical protein VNO77_02879 [Canavalia gladiata]|uniref:Uncharacterized protein n=1 Tax=Canavalia gladiata TaxID=3824 RepID=A0AAN9MYZ9_CANGL